MSKYSPNSLMDLVLPGLQGVIGELFVGSVVLFFSGFT